MYFSICCHNYSVLNVSILAADVSPVNSSVIFKFVEVYPPLITASEVVAKPAPNLLVVDKAGFVDQEVPSYPSTPSALGTGFPPIQRTADCVPFCDGET